MTNKNDDRIIKKGSKVFSKKYIAKKRGKEEIEKPRSKIFFFLIFLAFLLGLSINLYTHPFMKIQDIYIQGNVITDDTEIIKKLRSPVGKNILLYDYKKSEKELKKLSFIKSARVRKVFPKIISVEITEDFPLYKIKDKDIYVTNNGLITKDVDKINTDRLIEIDTNSYNKEIGQNFTSSETSMNFIKELSASSLIGRVSKLNLENKLDIGIMIQDIEVKFGDLNNVEYKIKLLNKVLADIKSKGKKVESINLNNGDNPEVVVD
ncbi:FtsQ-type POTRA domain-containing protein [uncultured Anaerococcus sp.]|uniref:cell division protein FtsQ/DivIB n=1 Tax=uncultured Anaerococcus sp. TaxID=293428 RepID=UPI0028890221|nr:FtsQ-type POTRA domain-containing protein [uncultured Anaerococcus sp.]